MPKPKQTPPAGKNKKRAVASDAPIPDGKARDEAERFASRIAIHLREAADVTGTPWDEARVKDAFHETVRNMPSGALKERLAEHLEHFTRMIADKTARPAPTDLPQEGEFGGPDHADFHELKKPLRLDFDSLSAEELIEETRRCLLKATYDLPCWLAQDKVGRCRLTPGLHS